MDVSVRCYLFDEDDRVLLVRHDKTSPWVLPGGHAEKEDLSVYETLKRELYEELGVDIVIIWAENEVSDSRVTVKPLPISMHVVSYEHRTKWPTQKFEYLFFARAQGELEKNEEIHAMQWMDVDEVLALDDGEIPAFFKEVLDQNIDLLEIIG